MRTLRVDAPLVVGAGLAGLAVAATLDPAPCTVLSSGTIGEHTSTGLAQGGLAAAIGADDDPSLHLADTLAAGAGLCDEPTARAITAAAPAVVEQLARWGARLDRDADGRPLLGLEAAHSRRRIVHAGGDASGAEYLRAVATAALASPGVTVMERTRALRVLVDGGRVVGVLAQLADRERVVLATSQVVLATGGVGGLFRHTTNPLGSRGRGLALAARAGASLRDVEMVQSHPTALDVGLDPMPLVSEAVRGEGALVVTADGERVCNPLAPRDVVARAEWAQMVAGREVFLDVRPVRGFAEHFPSIHASCLAAGIDPARELVPIRPAAHYHMGGIRAGLDGSTDVVGLSAVGECASTGLHGANRLASNSLLEAVACGRWTAQRLAGTVTTSPTLAAERAASRVQPATGPVPVPVRELVERDAGILRDATGLQRLVDALTPHLAHDDALVGWAIATAALARTESRGGHTRIDHPGTDTVATHTLTHMPRTELEAA